MSMKTKKKTLTVFALNINVYLTFPNHKCISNRDLHADTSYIQQNGRRMDHHLEDRPVCFQLRDKSHPSTARYHFRFVRNRRSPNNESAVCTCRYFSCTMTMFDIPLELSKAWTSHHDALNSVLRCMSVERTYLSNSYWRKWPQVGRLCPSL